MITLAGGPLANTLNYKLMQTAGNLQEQNDLLFSPVTLTQVQPPSWTDIKAYLHTHLFYRCIGLVDSVSEETRRIGARECLVLAERDTAKRMCVTVSREPPPPKSNPLRSTGGFNNLCST
jgi:hypothetical protein